MGFFEGTKDKQVLLESRQSKEAKKRLLKIAETPETDITRRQIAGLSDLEKQAFDLAEQFLQDDTGEITIDKAIEVATQMAERQVDFNDPEIQGIIQEVRKTGDLALNRIGRGLQLQGAASTTAGRDVLGRSIKETELATAGALSPILDRFRSLKLGATSLLPSLVTQKAGTTQGRIQTGAAAGGVISGIQQRIKDALFTQQQQQFEFKTFGRADILGGVTSSPQVITKLGGPSEAEKILSAGQQTAGLVSLAGQAAALSDRNTKENIELITDALDKIDQLAGYSYNYIGNDPEKRNAGIMAQDLEKVLPEAVFEKDGVKHVRFDAIAALLVEAFKELKQQIQNN